MTPPLGMKFDKSKPRWSLLPLVAVEAVIGVLEYGAQKYAPDNWRKVENARTRYYDAAMRHIHAWWGGDTIDQESGHHHLAHAICCLIFLLAVEIEEAE